MDASTPSTIKHLKKSSWEKKILSFLSPERTKRRKHDVELDAEKLTAEESMSRLLYNPKPKIKIPKEGTIFDHFVIVGAKQDDSATPKILYSFPESPLPNYPGLEDFCFPESVKTNPVELSNCNSELIELTHNQRHLHQPENNFVFLFTDNESNIYYGICIHKMELIENAPLCINTLVEATESHASTVRCYCLVSKFPFFRLHFDFLLSLFCEYLFLYFNPNE